MSRTSLCLLACGTLIVSSLCLDASATPLAEAMRDTSPAVRRAAVNALRTHPDTGMTLLLVAALYDKDTAVRFGALNALGKAADRRALGPLLAIVDSTHGDMRAGATWAVGRMESDSALPQLQRALTDTSPCVRTWAAVGLGRIRSASATPALVGALADDDLAVRFAAVRALGLTRDPAAAPPLTRVTRLALDGKLSQAAAFALGALGPVGVESLCGLLTDSSAALRLASARALAKDTSLAAAAALLSAARRRETPILAGVYDFYIRHDEPWTDTLLAGALRQQGSMEMANAMYGSGRVLLTTAARKWDRGVPRYPVDPVLTLNRAPEYDWQDWIPR